MKTGLLLWLAVMAAPLTAYAGHGTIVETDTAFIVDYTGDASDKAAEKAVDKAVEKAAPAVAKQIIPAAQAQVTAAPPAAAADKPVLTATAKPTFKYVRQQRQKRNGPWHRPEGMVDTANEDD